MDLLLDGVIDKEEHQKRRSGFMDRRQAILNEINAHNQADDKFAERLEDILKISGNAYRQFQLSNVPEKRRLGEFGVFDTEITGGGGGGRNL